MYCNMHCFETQTIERKCRILLHYVKQCNGICTSKRRLDGRTVIITGGTSGMGLEIAVDLAERGARVIVACPFEDEGETGTKAIIQRSGSDNVVFKLLDLSLMSSVRKFAKDILENERRVDILVNNAGTCARQQFHTSDGLNYIMAVNYYGAYLLTLLLPLLRKSKDEPARIINVSSVLHYFGLIDIENLNSVNRSTSAVRVYANSKLCLTLFTMELARRIKSNAIIHAVDPGAVGTPIYLTFAGKIGILATIILKYVQKTPWEGMQTALHVTLDREAGSTSGGFYRNCEPARARKTAYDEKLAGRLWTESARLVNLSEEDVQNLLYK
ncbi:retinol dehydrogenase 11-like [Aricia agestis]|uniref:retinol dehydrogenase 11-like n=1 Tax=Aricia agestis TaxID=91739 RepID=UPI001C2056FC|nr:retinol dehydrogenase 11-like [Aricia agestis]